MHAHTCTHTHTCTCTHTHTHTHTHAQAQAAGRSVGAAVCCNMMRCSAVCDHHTGALEDSIRCIRMVQVVVGCGSVLQHYTTCCRLVCCSSRATDTKIAAMRISDTFRKSMNCPATDCNSLQPTATRGHTLHYTATHCIIERWGLIVISSEHMHILKRTYISQP